jgi:type I restriction enzyme S subunit
MSASLIEHFDLLATAPGGVARLRELILTLAVQGKLVPQDPGDEPASVLLQKIRAEKDRLIAAGKIKRDKPLAPIADEEKPFGLPVGWEWVRFGEVALISSGVTLGRKTALPRPVVLPYLRVANVQRWHLNLDQMKDVVIDSSELSRFQIQNGDLLITEGGDWDKVGRTAIWRDELPACLHQNHVFKARGLCADWNPVWAELFLNSPTARVYFAASAKQTTNLASINMTELKHCAFPLPPLAEQSRIVARVQELMRLCDALEAKGKLDARQHAQLLQTLLGTLADSATPEELAAHWQRVAEHFDLLLDRPEAVDALEQTILQLAVRGLLVPQDPSDEPASVLLQKIRAEKDRLIAVGKIKRDKPLAPIADVEKPFELPVGWEWVRFGEIAGIERGGSPRPIDAFLTDDPAGLNWIKIGDTEKGGKYITSTSQKIKREGLVKTRMVFPGDFLLTNSMSFGRPYITQIQGCIHDGWLRISPPHSLDKDFLYTLLSSPYVRNVFEAAAAGGVVQNLNADKVRIVPIPLPPLAEQSRIVARVEELRQLCADLRQRLTASRTTQGHLAQALVDAAGAA